MMELTEQQMQALENPGAMPPRIVNPRTKETFVLLRLEDYERRKDEEYDAFVLATYIERHDTCASAIIGRAAAGVKAFSELPARADFWREFVPDATLGD